MKLDRAFGVLTHPTSLPGRFGLGDLGPAAHAYAEWLARAGARWWQVLPLHAPAMGHSPYSACSAFAGNTKLISPERLVDEGLLEGSDLTVPADLPQSHVDYARAAPFKRALLERMWERAGGTVPPHLRDEFHTFAARERAWLDPFALFIAIKETEQGRPWHEWPAPLAGGDAEACAAWREQHVRAVDFHRFAQFLFWRQWADLRRRTAELGIEFFGDLPMFVADDSADVWANRDQFLLDENGEPTVVTGVPPDYFSDEGQYWGNPHYDWERMAQDGYRWWIDRIRHELALTTLLRLDHFRGFAAFWEIPAQSESAKDGRWVTGPGRKLFDALRDALGDLPLVAEDLGDITPDVNELRDALGLPGMAILQFAFNPHPRSDFLPYKHRQHLLVYTGTHDNNTIRGWYDDEATETEKQFLRDYLGGLSNEVHWDLIRLALSSHADLAIVQHQDVAGLGSVARMNRPGAGEGNWRFRLTPEMLDPALAERLRELAWIYGRCESR